MLFEPSRFSVADTSNNLANQESNGKYLSQKALKLRSISRMHNNYEISFTPELQLNSSKSTNDIMVTLQTPSYKATLVLGM